MNLSAPFIHRPVATTLLTIGVALSGTLAFTLLPVASLPQIDFPTVSVSVSLPGANPTTMASSVATPLEREFGRIAGVTEMTSNSSLGSASVTMQFDLSRDIDGAVRDVQAAINAARANLPTDLPSNPTYRKVNPAEAPILILTLTSDTLSRGEMYDAASTILAQKISQLPGVGQVTVGGSSLPGIRVELNPDSLNKYGIGLEDVRSALSSSNANRPKGHFSDGDHIWTIEANDQLNTVSDYANLIVTYRNGAPVRVKDIADVTKDIENIRNDGRANGKGSVLLVIFREPGANIIETVDHIVALIPQLRASIPQSIQMQVGIDRTVTIRASLHDVERTLVISILLVLLVVFLFLHDLRIMFIPGIAVPVSLLGTFGVMYLLGFSLDNLSLMALTISTGFVVDDAIVVVENITRYIEEGLSPMQAALRGAREISFTVFSISLSLIAVFIPLLLMGGLVGRLFREFAVTLAVAIAVSAVISLTTTPMMCAALLRAHDKNAKPSLFARCSEYVFGIIHRSYEFTLRPILRHPLLTMLGLVLTITLNGYLIFAVPKGFFPQQDTGRIMGSLQGDQATSFQSMQKRLVEMMAIVQKDPAVDTVIGFLGGGGPGGGNVSKATVFMGLKSIDQRVSSDLVIARLRKVLGKIPGATLYMQAAQDLQIGGRQGNAQYQYTLQSDDYNDLVEWSPKLMAEIVKSSIMVDASSDLQNHGREAILTYDRDTASKLNISTSLLDQTLYDAFGQRQVSVMFTPLNQYHVVMEVAPKYWQNPEGLKSIYVKSASGGMVPLSAVTHYSDSASPLSINHQGPFPASTISFNLVPGASLGDAVNEMTKISQKIRLPESVRGSFQGTAQQFQSSLSTEPLLILAAIATVYIILGMLYESYIHPITILSTLPSAGVGALLALILFQINLDLISVIGIILLIGIVKKNAILVVDFAIAAERDRGLSSLDAITQACLLRFRPILMTTLAALLGAVPLAFDIGTGAELRRPLGVAIIGGLILSQILTLYTTPVLYLLLDKLSLKRKRPAPRLLPSTLPAES